MQQCELTDLTQEFVHLLLSGKERLRKKWLSKLKQNPSSNKPKD